MRKLLVLMLLAVVGCTPTNTETIREVKVDVTATPAPTASQNTTCATEFGRHVRVWNRRSGVLLADYLDVSVTAEEYLVTSDRELPELEDVVKQLRSSVFGCSTPPPPGMRLGELIATYEDKLDGYTALGNAVRFGTGANQDAAFEQILQANDRSLAILCDITEGEAGDAAAALLGGNVCE